MSRTITWNGTSEEAGALLRALSAYCECRVERGRTVASCASHSLLTRDQRTLDGLLFMRRMAAQLLAEEFSAGPGSAATAVQPASETSVPV